MRTPALSLEALRRKQRQASSCWTSILKPDDCAQAHAGAPVQSAAHSSAVEPALASELRGHIASLEGTLGTLTNAI